MSYIKLRVLIISLLVLNQASFANKFSSKECLDSVYKTEIKSEGKFFGLIKNDLFIEKNKCNIEIKFKGILETLWKVDLCREPIHMKVSAKGSESVYKRVKKCDDKSTDDFCYYLKELREKISDTGLIFSKGLKEKLADSHGQTYCTSLLLDRYFIDGIVFSSFDEPINIYKSQESCSVPMKEKERVSEQIKEVVQEADLSDKSINVTVPVTNSEKDESKRKF